VQNGASVSYSYSKRVSGDRLHFTGHFKVVIDQGCSVVCVKFDMKIFITEPYGFRYYFTID